MTVLDRAAVLGLPELPFARPATNNIDPRISTLKIISKRKTRQSQSVSGRLMTRSSDAQWYEMKISFAPMRRSQIAPIISFLEAQKGRGEVFRVPVAPITGVSGEIVGQYVNFAEDSKLHMITDISDGTAVTPLPRYGATTLRHDDVYMVCSLKRDAQTVNIDSKGMVRLSLDLIERI